jgi:hypothetical protein
MDGKVRSYTEREISSKEKRIHNLDFVLFLNSDSRERLSPAK